MTRWITFALAAFGLLIGIYTVSTAGREEHEPPPAAPPSVNPFAVGVAATGIVEAASRNIEVSAPEPSLVTEVFVDVGSRVERGAPLFRLDTRPLEAQLGAAKAEVDVAAADEAFERLELERLREVLARGAATQQEVARQQAQFDAAVARTRQVAAQVTRIGRDIDRLTVAAPIDGTVLRRDIEPGEYATPGAGAQAAMVLGDLTQLHVRAQVDEEDAPRLRPGAAAVARVRGLARDPITLEMIRIEPFAGPKRQLTGDAREIVDTRVVEVLFRVSEEAPPPIVPGQLLDVFIDASATPTTDVATPPSAGDPSRPR